MSKLSFNDVKDNFSEFAQLGFQLQGSYPFLQTSLQLPQSWECGAPGRQLPSSLDPLREGSPVQVRRSPLGVTGSLELIESDSAYLCSVRVLATWRAGGGDEAGEGFEWGSLSSWLCQEAFG